MSVHDLRDLLPPELKVRSNCVGGVVCFGVDAHGSLLRGREIETFERCCCCCFAAESDRRGTPTLTTSCVRLWTPTAGVLMRVQSKQDPSGIGAPPPFFVVAIPTAVPAANNAGPSLVPPLSLIHSSHPSTRRMYHTSSLSFLLA